MRVRPWSVTLNVRMSMLLRIFFDGPDFLGPVIFTSLVASRPETMVVAASAGVAVKSRTREVSAAKWRIACDTTCSSVKFAVQGT